MHHPPSMTEPRAKTEIDLRLRRAVLVLIYMAIAAGAITFLHYLRPLVRVALNVLSPFLVAIIVAYIFNPLVTAIEARFKLGRMAGVFVAYVIILGLTAGFFAILLPVLYVQLRDFISGIVTQVHIQHREQNGKKSGS